MEKQSTFQTLGGEVFEPEGLRFLDVEQFLGSSAVVVFEFPITGRIEGGATHGFSCALCTLAGGIFRQCGIWPILLG